MYVVVLTAAAVSIFAVLVLTYWVLRKAHGAAPGYSPLDRIVLSGLGRLISLLLRCGVRLGPMMLLTVRGRSTGMDRTNPVDLLGSDGRYWLVATHDARANWVRNLRAAGVGTLACGRRRFLFSAVELDQNDAGQVLEDVLSPRLAKPLGGFVLRQTMGVTADASPGDYLSAAALHPVFELTLDNNQGDPMTVRSVKVQTLAIILGSLIALVHGILGLTGIMTGAQWISGVVIGLVIAGVGNHLRIFGRPRARHGQRPAK